MGRFSPDPDGYLLYGTDFSYYTCKLKAYLLAKGIPFSQRVSTVAVYKRFIIQRTGVAFIPVLQTPDDQVWQDTAVIIDQLELRFPNGSILPSTPRQRTAAQLLDLFGSEFLLLPAMHHRWNHPENGPVLFQQFGALAASWAPRLVQRMLGQRLSKRFRGFLPGLGITDESAPAIARWYEGLLGQLQSHFEQHDYLLGPRLSLADVGFAGPFAGHLAQDPWPKNHLRRVAPAVANWSQRMLAAPTAPQADWLPDDQLPPTLLPILEQWATWHWPILDSVMATFAAWSDGRASGDKVSRRLGEHSADLFGSPVNRAVTSHPVWLLQRLRDDLIGLPESDRLQAQQLLSEIGAADALDQSAQRRLSRQANRLVLV